MEITELETEAEKQLCLAAEKLEMAAIALHKNDRHLAKIYRQQAKAHRTMSKDLKQKAHEKRQSQGTLCIPSAIMIMWRKQTCIRVLLPMLLPDMHCAWV